MVRNKEVEVVTVRVPRDVKEWLERQSSHHLSSQNSEVVRCIRARMAAEQHGGGA
jgi:hypothetical protein